QANAADADGGRVKLETGDADAGEGRKVEGSLQVALWLVVRLDDRRHPGDDFNLGADRAVVAGGRAVPGHEIGQRHLADDQRALADRLAHDRLVDDVVGARR